MFCAYCQPWRGGVTFDSLVNVPRCRVATLPRYRVATLIVGVASKCPRSVEDVPRCFALEDSKTYHVVKLFCGRSFATLFALCVSFGGVVLSYFAVEDFAVVGVFSLYPSATPAACR